MKTVKKSKAVLCALMALLFAPGLLADDITEYVKDVAREPIPQPGEEYYMRHCIWFERGDSEATNYARGALVPINTKVTLLAYGDDEFTIRIGTTSQVVEIENEHKYTQKSISEIARNMLSKKEVSLKRYDDDIAAAIRNGQMRLGMTKVQVLMARGWPPAHRTPTLEQDAWVYWPSRFITQTIVFKDGKLAEGRDIH